MPEAISDSSTLIHLAGIGRLGLLKAFYDKIFITPAVWREVVEEGGGRPGAQEIKEAHTSSWIEIVAPSNESLVRLLERELHKGEAEAIALATQISIRRAAPLISDATLPRNEDLPLFTSNAKP